MLYSTCQSRQELGRRHGLFSRTGLARMEVSQPRTEGRARLARPDSGPGPIPRLRGFLPSAVDASRLAALAQLDSGASEQWPLPRCLGVCNTLTPETQGTTDTAVCPGAGVTPPWQST